MLDLEPDRITTRLVVVASSIGAARHVSHDGAHVGVRPQSPVKGDCRASRGGSVQSCWCAAGIASIGVAIALQVNQTDVEDRTISWDLARDALGDRVHVWVGVGVVELVELAADGGIVDIAVSGHEGS